MDVLDKLNSYGQGYREEGVVELDVVFAEVATEVISLLREIRDELHSRDRAEGWSDVSTVVADRRQGGASDRRGRDRCGA